MALVVASSVGGWLVGRQITSPAEVAARTAAPEASPILVPVESRQLTSDVITRGSGQFGSPEKLTVATSALKPAPGIIAELPTLGTEVAEGQTIMSASGRPLLMMQGSQPMARDLGPGVIGRDVQQLEDGLKRLGFFNDEPDENFDTTTEFAVVQWYDSVGYTPFAATNDQLASVRQQEAALATARADSLAAGDSVAAANEVVVTARNAVDTARNVLNFAPAALDRARKEAASNNSAALLEVAQRQAALDGLDVNSPATTATAEEVAAARAELDGAKAAAAQTKLDGGRAVSDARSTLDSAPARLAEARSEAAANNATAQAEVNTTKAALDLVQSDPAASPEELAAAQAAYDAARLAADTAKAAGEQAIAAAQATLDGARAALDAAIADAAASDAVAQQLVEAKQAALDAALTPRKVTAADVASARKDLEIAQKNSESIAIAGERSVAEAESTLAGAQIEVTNARAAVAAAENAYAVIQRSAEARGEIVNYAAEEASLAKRSAGVQVPADELIFVSSGPIRVSEVLLARGDLLSGAVVKATNAEVYVVGGLAVQDAGLITAGMEASIDEPDLGIAIKGLVTLVAPSPGTNAQDAFHVYFEVRVTSPPANLIGASARVTIPVESTTGESLVVPISALTMAPDGSSRIEVSAEGTTRQLTVTAGLSADGFVAVTPKDGELKAGELVVIGFTPPVGSTVGSDATGDTTPSDATASTVVSTASTVVSTASTVAAGS